MQGSTTGYIRFDTPEQTKIALDNTEDGKVVICDRPAFVKILEGGEEHEYFEKVAPYCRWLLFCSHILPSDHAPSCSAWRRFCMLLA